MVCHSKNLELSKSKTSISPTQDELRLHMFDKHPKPGDDTVVFPSQAMDPEQLLASSGMELKIFHSCRNKMLGHIAICKYSNVEVSNLCKATDGMMFWVNSNSNREHGKPCRG